MLLTPIGVGFGDISTDGKIGHTNVAIVDIWAQNIAQTLLFWVKLNCQTLGRCHTSFCRIEFLPSVKVQDGYADQKTSQPFVTHLLGDEWQMGDIFG